MKVGLLKLRHIIGFPVLISLCVFSGDCGLETVQAKNKRVNIGDEFPRVELSYLGTTKKFDPQLLKDKVAVIDFWASDCHPCREAVPELNSLAKSFKKLPVVFIGINVDGDPKDTKVFLEEFKPLYVLLDDSKHGFISKMGVDLMPTTYVADRKGRVRYINKGFRTGDADKLKGEIEKALKRTKKDAN